LSAGVAFRQQIRRRTTQWPGFSTTHSVAKPIAGGESPVAETKTTKAADLAAFASPIGRGTFTKSDAAAPEISRQNSGLQRPRLDQTFPAYLHVSGADSVEVPGGETS